MTDTRRWDEALDALHQHLRAAEALLEGDLEDLEIDAWVAPHGLGPMPVHLVDRAAALRTRQAALLTTLAAALAENRKQRQMAERMDTTPARRSDARYVDVSA